MRVLKGLSGEDSGYRKRRRTPFAVPEIASAPWSGARFRPRQRYRLPSARPRRRGGDNTRAGARRDRSFSEKEKDADASFLFGEGEI